MNIAVVSEDGVTISQHFGMAPWYIVYTIENGKVTATDKREKAGHHHMGGGPAHPAHGQTHGQDPASQNLHTKMADAIADCQVVIAGGMGMGAYESLKSYKIEPIITDVKDINQAVNQYIQGTLPNLRERLH
jgi:predicted Fe-Mo cluster-binding NifX family protein